MGFRVGQVLKNFLALLVILVLFLVDLSNLKTQAAGPSALLKLTPSPINATINSEFSVSLKIRSDLESLNAIDAKLKFDPSLVKVSGVDTNGSVVTTWAENNYDNLTGQVSLVGGVISGTPNLGYISNGTDGHIAVIKFTPLKAGSGNISIDNSSMVLSNNLNENILVSPTNSQPSLVNINIAAPSSGDGLLGSYFNSRLLTGAKVLERVDKTIDFNWVKNSPASLVNANNFGIRWTGFLLPKTTGEHTIHFYSDDGSRVFINNKLIINQWSDHSAKEYTAKVNLTAGVKVPIKIEYYENKGLATAKLYWSSKTQKKEIIPQIVLYSK